MARHRWEATSDHFYPGPKYWRCVHCDLSKLTEWEVPPRYSSNDGREWYRFAPPCPPPADLPSLTRLDAEARHLASHKAARAKSEQRYRTIMAKHGGR